jgi:hypothetical protein
MRSRLILLALLVIAMMTAPGLRADLGARGRAQLAQRDERLALQSAHKRQSLHSERRGGTSRHGQGKSGPLALLPALPLRVLLPVSRLAPLVLSSLREAAYRGPQRARAPPSAA